MKCFVGFFLVTFLAANKNLVRSFTTLWHTLTFFFHLRAQWFKKIFALLPSRLKRLLLCSEDILSSVCSEEANFIYLVLHSQLSVVLRFIELEISPEGPRVNHTLRIKVNMQITRLSFASNVNGLTGGCQLFSTNCTRRWSRWKRTASL